MRLINEWQKGVRSFNSRIALSYLIFFTCTTLLLSCTNTNIKLAQTSGSEKQDLNSLQNLIAAPESSKLYLEGFPLTCFIPYASRISDDYQQGVEFGNIARVYAEAGDYEEALTLVRTTQPRTDVDIVDNIIDQQIKDGLQEQAFQLSNLSYVGVARDGRIALIASSYVEQEQYEKAIAMIANVSSDQDRYKAVVLSEIAASYARRGQPSQASEFFQQAQALIETLSGDEKINATIGISISYAKAGYYEKALETIDTFRTFTLTTKEFRNFRAVTWREVARSAVDHASAAEAEKILSQILSEIRSNPDFDVLQSDLSIMYTELGQFDQALRIVNLIENKYWRIRTLMTIAEGYWKINQTDQASQLLHKTLQEIQDLENYSLRADLLVTLSNTYSKLRETDSAVEVLAQALQTALIIKDNHERDSELSDISKHFFRVKEHERALAAVARIQDPVIKSSLTELFKCSS